MVKVAKASSLMAQPHPKPCHLNKSTVTSSTAEPVLNAPMLSATTRSKPHPKPRCLNTSGCASVAEPVPNTLQPSTSTLATQPRPHPQKCHSLNQSGVPSTNPVDGAACDSMDNVSDDFFIVSHVCGSILEKSDTSSESFVPETPMTKTVRALSHSSESFVPETPMRRDENTPRLQPYVATSQAGWGSTTPVCTYLKRHPKVVIPRRLNKMFGQPHGHLHAVSVESDPVVGRPLVLGQWKIMGLPKCAAPSSPNPRPWEDCSSSPSPGPNDHPGDTADAMCDAEGRDPGSWPRGDCSGGDSSEEDEDLEAKAACDGGTDLMEGCEPAEMPGEPYVGGHFSKEELKELSLINHDIARCIGTFSKYYNPWDPFLALNRKTDPSMKQSPYVTQIAQPAYNALVAEHGGKGSAAWKELIAEHEECKASSYKGFKTNDQDQVLAMKQLTTAWKKDASTAYAGGIHIAFVMASNIDAEATNKHNGLFTNYKAMEDFMLGALGNRKVFLLKLHAGV